MLIDELSAPNSSREQMSVIASPIEGVSVKIANE